MKRSLWVMAISLLLAASGSGCGKQNTGADGTMKGQAYQADGLLGVTSANPNDPLNPSYHHYADDVRMIKDTIKTLPQVTDSHIVLNGPTAYITLKLHDEVDIEEASRIRYEAQERLTRMMPRYHIRVNVRKNHLKQPGHY